MGWRLAYKIERICPVPYPGLADDQAVAIDLPLPQFG